MSTWSNTFGNSGGSIYSSRPAPSSNNADLYKPRQQGTSSMSVQDNGGDAVNVSGNPSSGKYKKDKVVVVKSIDEIARNVSSKFKFSPYNKFSWHDKLILANYSTMIYWCCNPGSSGGDVNKMDKIFVAMQCGGVYAFGYDDANYFENAAKFMFPTNPLQPGFCNGSYNYFRSFKPNKSAFEKGTSEEIVFTRLFEFLFANIAVGVDVLPAEYVPDMINRYFESEERMFNFRHVIFKAIALINQVVTGVTDDASSNALFANVTPPQITSEVGDANVNFGPPAAMTVVGIKRAVVQWAFKQHYLVYAPWEPCWRLKCHLGQPPYAVSEGTPNSDNDDFVTRFTPELPPTGLPAEFYAKHLLLPDCKELAELLSGKYIEATRENQPFSGCLTATMTQLRLRLSCAPNPSMSLTSCQGESVSGFGYPVAGVDRFPTNVPWTEYVRSRLRGDDAANFKSANPAAWMNLQHLVTAAACNDMWNIIICRWRGPQLKLFAFDESQVAKFTGFGGRDARLLFDSFQVVGEHVEYVPKDSDSKTQPLMPHVWSVNAIIKTKMHEEAIIVGGSGRVAEVYGQPNDNNDNNNNNNSAPQGGPTRAANSGPAAHNPTYLDDDELEDFNN